MCVLAPLEWVGELHRWGGKEKCRGHTRKRQRGFVRLCGALLVCGCGRFDISGAFNPGTGNRWCWEIKLLSPQPRRSVPGVCLSVFVSLFSFSPCFQCVSLICLPTASHHLVPFVSVFGWLKSVPLHAGKQNDTSRVVSGVMQETGYYWEQWVENNRRGQKEKCGGDVMGYKQKGDHEQTMLRGSCDVEQHSKYSLGWCVF